MAAAGLSRFRTRRQIEDDKREERLYFAIQNGDVRTLELLLDNGCNPDHKFEGSNLLNRRLLHVSCEKGQEECAALLLRYGANPEPQDAWFQTPLMCSVCTERDNMVRLMLQQDIDVNMTDKFGRSALHIAVNNVERDCLTLLLEGGADVNVSDEQGKNPLYHAIMKDGRADVIRMLIENNCDVNNRDMREKRMPLAAAIMNAKEDVVTYVQILLEAGADPNASDHFGFTPMTSLIKRGFRDGPEVQEKHLQVAKLLVLHGHNVNISLEPKYWFQYSGTALKMAAERNSPKLVRFLLEHHADPDIGDDKGIRPLHVAASKNSVHLAKLLIAANADLNVVAEVKPHRSAWESIDVTPIKYALLSGSKEVAQILLAAGCHVTLEDYVWCEIHAASLLQESAESAGAFEPEVVGDRDREDLRWGAAASDTIIRPNPLQRSSSDFISDPDHQSNLLLRSNTDPDSGRLSAPARDHQSGARRGRSSQLQQLLSAAASQPPDLFQQSVALIRRLLGQPFDYKVSRLLLHEGLADVIPTYRLRAWLHLTHVTGNASHE